MHGFTSRLTGSLGCGKVHFTTNLDLDNREALPGVLCCRPMVGDRIESTYAWGNQLPKQHLELEVVSVRLGEGCLHVELHLPKGRWESLSQFYKGWYEKVTRRTFI